MGNYFSSSCCFLTNFHYSSSTAKLLDSQGNLRQVRLPVKAAELMLEQPGHAVCSMQELRRCGRVVAVRAEDDLRAGEMYLFVLLSRVHSKISEAEMGNVLKYAASVAKKRRSGGAKVLPAVVAAEEQERRDHVISSLELNEPGFSAHRSRNCKHWTPVLEPISEEF